MHRITLPRLAALGGLTLALSVFGPAPAVGAAPGKGPSTASFEGRTIDLRVSWEGATACASDGSKTTCFRTEEQMNAFLADEVQAGPMSERSSEDSQPISAAASCADALRLYDFTGYSGPVLSLYSQGIWLNLSAYGFSARADSYRVGGCGAYFAEATSGGGSWYPGSTSAYSASPDMGSWRNRVRSVYIS